MLRQLLLRVLRLQTLLLRVLRLQTLLLREQLSVHDLLQALLPSSL